MTGGARSAQQAVREYQARYVSEGERALEPVRKWQHLVRWLLAITAIIATVSLVYHPVTLKWTPSTTVSSKLVYNVYRASAPCSAEAPRELIARTKEAEYIDRSVKFGVFCYVVRASVNGVESADSNSSEVTIRPTWNHHWR